MSYYFFCHVTDEQPLNTRPSMRGENDQIDALIFCRVENLFEGIAACDKVSDLWQVLDPWVTKLFQQDLSVFDSSPQNLGAFGGFVLIHFD